MNLDFKKVSFFFNKFHPCSRSPVRVSVQFIQYTGKNIKHIQFIHLNSGYASNIKNYVIKYISIWNRYVINKRIIQYIHMN